MTLLTIVLILWFNRFLQILSPFCRFVRKKQWKFFSTYFAKRREPPKCFLEGFQNIHFGSTSQTDSRNGRLEWEMMGALGWTCVHQNKKREDTGDLPALSFWNGRWWEWQMVGALSSPWQYLLIGGGSLSINHHLATDDHHFTISYHSTV